jgi:glycogen debranching enzyme
VYGSGAGHEWADYQFRCNFPIAATVAPELFQPEHALGALKLADQVLRAPLGMRTLDPSDMQYRPNYDNSNDSDDASIAKGLNYHQGPEWGWPLGYFLRAYLHFDLLVGEGKQVSTHFSLTDTGLIIVNQNPQETLHHLHTMLVTSRKYIQNDPWKGIPELTNENGNYCHDSCRTQAWSGSTLLDFLEDAHSLQDRK